MDVGITGIPALSDGIATSLLDTRETLKIPLFKIDRRKLPVEAMSAFGIVEHLGVIEDIVLGFSTGRVDLSPDTSAFYQLEEAFGDSIIVAVSAPAHALLQIVGIERSRQS